MNAVIAKALLKSCTGNQAIILQNMFRRKGFLDVPSIRDLFDIKVATAKTAVDRIDILSKDLTDNEKKVMSKTRSKVRKDIVGDIGKVFMHIDKSCSMHGAIEFAKDRGAIFAECVKNPEDNFGWGLFGTNGKALNTPKAFTKEDFHSTLYGITASDGSTDTLATYKIARRFGAGVDVYVTDQGHNVGDFDSRLKKLMDENGKPNAVIIIDFGHGESGTLYRGFEKANIPVSIIKPGALKESALVAQAVHQAVKGQMALVDEIMETELPKLPAWYLDSSLEKDYLTRLGKNGKTKA